MAVVTNTVPSLRQEDSGLVCNSAFYDLNIWLQRKLTTADMEQLQRLAVERLKHSVSELQTLVDHDRRNQPLPPPKPTTLHLITDTSALTTSVGDLKTYVGDESARITVPSAVLDSLDALKRGSDTENVNARETVRWFDRIIGKGGSDKGIKIQAPNEVYGTWQECLEWYNPPPSADTAAQSGFAAPDAMTESMMLSKTTEVMDQLSISPPSSPTLAPTNVPRLLKAGQTFNEGPGRKDLPPIITRANTMPVMKEPPSPTSPLPNPEVPRRIQPIINCALECLHSEKPEISKSSEGVLYLVTNNPEITHWAKCFGVPVLNTKELNNKIYEENRLYKEKKNDWQFSQSRAQNNSNLVGGKVNYGNSGNVKQDHMTPNGARGGRNENAPSGRRRNRHNQNANFNSNSNTNNNGQQNSVNGGNNHINNISPSARGGRPIGRAGYQIPIARSATIGTPKELENKFAGSPESIPQFPTSPNRNGFRPRENKQEQPEYILGRGANRGVARGKGKLWVP